MVPKAGRRDFHFWKTSCADGTFPRERMLEVAEHYQHFGGVSPINQQCRDLLAALEPQLLEAGCTLPVFWGNRNWSPYLTDVVREMTARGLKRRRCS